jgi:hypothetical protein
MRIRTGNTIRHYTEAVHRRTLQYLMKVIPQNQKKTLSGTIKIIKLEVTLAAREKRYKKGQNRAAKNLIRSPIPFDTDMLYRIHLLINFTVYKYCNYY